MHSLVAAELLEQVLTMVTGFPSPEDTLSLSLCSGSKSETLPTFFTPNKPNERIQSCTSFVYQGEGSKGADGDPAPFLCMSWKLDKTNLHFQKPNKAKASPSLFVLPVYMSKNKKRTTLFLFVPRRDQLPSPFQSSSSHDRTA